MLLLATVDRDAFLSGAAVAVVDLRTGAAGFAADFIAVRPAGFACAADLTGGFAVLTVPEVAAIFFSAAGLGDFTALLAGVFFAVEAADLVAGFVGFAGALAVFPVGLFTDDLAGAFLLAAGFARVAATVFGAIFLLFADFVTVAFIVPCP